MTALTGPDMNLERIRAIAALGILGLVAASVILNFIDPDRHIENIVSVLAVAVAGYLFAPVLTNRKNGDNHK